VVQLFEPEPVIVTVIEIAIIAVPDAMIVATSSKALDSGQR